MRWRYLRCLGWGRGSQCRGRRCCCRSRLRGRRWGRVRSLLGLSTVFPFSDGDDKFWEREKKKQGHTWREILHPSRWNTRETANTHISCEFRKAIEEGWAYLSLQFPGWPTPPSQRMMIFVERDGPAQKEPPVEGQVKALIVWLLLGVDGQWICLQESE